MKKDWLSTTRAAADLGLTPRQLLALRAAGVLESGKHYRKKNPQAARPSYLWHVDRCSKIL